jgi:hypothetical protein
VNGRVQRKITFGLVVALVGAGLAVVALVRGQDRFILARFVALGLLGLWLAVFAWREGKKPVRRWWG